MNFTGKTDARLKALFAKISASVFAIRTVIVNDTGFDDAANSQSSRSVESMLGLALVKNANNQVALRLAVEKPYIAYSALLSQSGTAAPTAKVLQEEIPNITFTRTSAGLYTIDCAAADFTADKVAVIVSQQGATGTVFTNATVVSTSLINLRTFAADVLTDDTLPADTFVEIRVYR